MYYILLLYISMYQLLLDILLSFYVYHKFWNMIRKII